MTNATTVLRGRETEVRIGDEHPFAIIGERINPTGRSMLTAELIAGDVTTVRTDAIAQVEAGARILDVNAGIPGFDEAELLANAIRAVLEVVDVPLCIDSSTPHVLETVLAIVPGKPIVNSVTAEADSLERLLPLVARSGAAVIGMANDERGISMEPQVRLEAARKIVRAAQAHGIAREDVIIDPLCMPIGADPNAAMAILETIALIRRELGVNVSCGASNVSFGLPDRRRLDGAFLAMAMAAGMNAAITDPRDEGIRSSIAAADVLLGRDFGARNWIRAYRARADVAPPAD